MRALTDIAIRKLKPGATRREIPDPGCRGLYVVVQPSGARSYAVRYRLAGKSRKLTLPPGISLAGARKLAGDVMLEIALGRDPAAAKQAAKRGDGGGRETFTAIAAEYLRRESLKPEGERPRSLKWREGVLRRHIYPTLGSRPIDQIKRSEIVRLLDRIEETSGASMADGVLAILRVIMNWHAARSDDFRSPIVRGLTRTADRPARDRILNDAELTAVWKAASADVGPFPALIQFLLLSAARRDEAARMRWDEIADDTWTLPASRNKTNVELIRPLSTAAQSILAKQPRIAGCPFVFTTDGRSPAGSYSRRKRQFDHQCGVTKWTLHDLRRTSRSLMSRAGVPVDHAERCLGHVVPGIRGVYDRHQYRAEMLHAYEALAVQIERILHPQDNVTALPARGSHAR
jgi:integrase